MTLASLAVIVFGLNLLVWKKTVFNKEHMVTVFADKKSGIYANT